MINAASSPLGDFQPGSLVRLRGRDWVVMPSQDQDVLRVKPLGGSAEEQVSLYLPLVKHLEHDVPCPAHFPSPTSEDLGPLFDAQLLYDAARLSFRDGSGPFRCLPKLSFRPRAYQMVPLIMALRQNAEEAVRLLIADDVGIGKTVEALLIARELLERGVIERFAIICLPHLCEQWQQEIKAKLGMDAVIIRSSTQAQLDREIQGDENVYRYYPFQILSIDYVKTEERRAVYVQSAPELVIVDEAHTCAKPAGASTSQQQRHRLLHDLASNTDRNLVMLTATPHSGKEEEFHSLLGLLQPEFTSLDLPSATQNQRRHLARYFVQRRRGDVIKWMGEDTPFPKRDAGEVNYELTRSYKNYFDEVLKFARKLVSRDSQEGKALKGHTWAALALLRGVMSSPATGQEMFRNRLNKIEESENSLTADEKEQLRQAVKAERAAQENHELFLERQRQKHEDISRMWAHIEKLRFNGGNEEHIEALEKELREYEQSENDSYENPDRDEAESFNNDAAFSQALEKIRLSRAERTQLKYFQEKISELYGFEFDAKLQNAANTIIGWLNQGYQPVIFCRYIETAKYVGEQLTRHFKTKWPKLRVEVVTSEDPDELRRERIDSMGEAEQRLLVATDCLSEGINLQDLFTAVMHYDLPWNPNRLEQREGRVDRYGQTAPEVKAHLLYGTDNPVDGIVLDVILRKVREIRKSTGITIPFPEDSQSVIDAVAQALLINPNRKIQTRSTSSDQLTFEFVEFPEADEARSRITKRLEAATEREKASRQVFAQHAIKAQELENDLREMDLAIGDPSTVERLVTRVVNERLGSAMSRTPKGWELRTTNLPFELRELLPEASVLPVSFTSPTPEKHHYLGRNHPFVEQLCQQLLADTIERREGKAARAAVMRSDLVARKTTLLLFRVRNVIKNAKTKHQIVAEEMILWGFSGNASRREFLSHQQAQELLSQTVPSDQLTDYARADLLNEELQDLELLKPDFDKVAEARSKKLVEAHERFGALVEKRKYQVVYPVLPMDILGIYVLLPTISQSSVAGGGA